MAVTDKLDHDALLGRNFRNIHELIHQATATDPLEVLAIQTRAQNNTVAWQDLVDQADQAQDGLEPIPFEDQLGPDYAFPRMNMLYQTDPDSNPDSSVETDIQLSKAANFIQGQRVDNTLVNFWKAANKEDSPFVTNKEVLMQWQKTKSVNPTPMSFCPNHDKKYWSWLTLSQHLGIQELIEPSLKS